jgi:hypothetical protein
MSANVKGGRLEGADALAEILWCREVRGRARRTLPAFE